MGLGPRKQLLAKGRPLSAGRTALCQLDTATDTWGEENLGELPTCHWPLASLYGTFLDY